MSKALKAAIETNDPVATTTAAKKVKDLCRKLPKADSPVAYACKIGAGAALEALLQVGAPIKGEDGYEGSHPFALAAEAGHAEPVRVMGEFARDKIPQDVVNHALFAAALNGRTEGARAVLEASKPMITERIISIAASWKDGKIL